MEAHRNHGPPVAFDESPLVSNIPDADVSLGPHSPWSPERRSRGSLLPPPDPENELATKRGRWKAKSGAQPRGRDANADERGEASRRANANGDGEPHRRRRLSRDGSGTSVSNRTLRREQFNENDSDMSDSGSDGKRASGRLGRSSTRASAASGGSHGKRQQSTTDNTDDEGGRGAPAFKGRLRSVVTVPATDGWRRASKDELRDGSSVEQRRRSSSGSRWKHRGASTDNSDKERGAAAPKASCRLDRRSVRASSGSRWKHRGASTDNSDRSVERLHRRLPVDWTDAAFEHRVAVDGSIEEHRPTTRTRSVERLHRRLLVGWIEAALEHRMQPTEASRSIDQRRGGRTV
jgi:hypothetical protein